MSDLISRQAAIDAITKINCISGTGVKTPVIAKCNAVMAIEGLPSAQQWIPCSEGAPKKTGYYICTCHDGACYRTSVLKWATGWVLTGSRSYWRVIAWLPLPEPWRGEEHETD